MIQLFRNLKINGNDILNFEELQKDFSLLEIYYQLEQFKDFAKIHCLPLKNRLFSGDYNRFNNKFWYSVICNDTEEYCAVSKYLIDTKTSFNKAIKNKYGSAEKVKQEIEKEAEALNLKRKFNYIFNKIKNVAEDFNKDDVLVLLAICELAQIDALTIKDFSLPERKTEQESDIHFISTDETLILNTTNKPYKYWYHSKKFLDEKEKIKTVKVKATGLNNKEVIIELYSDNDEQLVDTLRLKNKEFLYCTVAGGKVIKFLSTESGSDGDLRLVREDYKKSEITVIQANGKKSTLSGDDVSCFSVASQSTGFMTVENGKLKYPFYDPAKKFQSVGLRLSSIRNKIIEVRVTDEEYNILTEDGTVITSDGIEVPCKSVALGR